MKSCITEFFGTFALLFFGTGAIVIDAEFAHKIGHLGIAITFGLVVAVMIFAFSEKSGAHFNPAVTLGFFIAGKFPLRQVFPYFISQFSGAILASFILHLLFPTNSSLGTTLPSGSAAQSFIMEIILATVLMVVILQVATGTKEQGMFAAITIGFTVLIEALVAGPVCGASMNPFRSLAPALVSGNFLFIWIYLVAPFVGVGLAVLIWKLIK
jgi:aquaporin NIP